MWMAAAKNVHRDLQRSLAGPFAHLVHDVVSERHRFNLDTQRHYLTNYACTRATA
jgi:hypothetical protein